MPKIDGGYRDLKPFFRLLDDVGDGTGTDAANANYAVTPKTFLLIPAIDEVVLVNQLMVHIADNASFGPTNYGGRAALGVGYDIKVTAPNMVAESLLGGEIIKHNDDFLHWGPGALDLVKFTGGSDSLVAAYRMEDCFGAPLVLNGSLGHKIEILLNDDFSTLIDHHFIAHGQV